MQVKIDVIEIDVIEIDVKKNEEAMAKPKIACICIRNGYRSDFKRLYGFRVTAFGCKITCATWGEALYELGCLYKAEYIKNNHVEV